MAAFTLTLFIAALPDQEPLNSHLSRLRHEQLHETLLLWCSHVLRRPAYKNVLYHWKPGIKREQREVSLTNDSRTQYEWLWSLDVESWSAYLVHVLPRVLACWHDEIRKHLQTGHLEAIAPLPECELLLREKPAPYHFVEIRNALHLVEVYDGTVETLRIWRVADWNRFPTSYTPFDKFNKRDQRRILNGMNEAVCHCDLCAHLRRRVKGNNN